MAFTDRLCGDGCGTTVRLAAEILLLLWWEDLETGLRSAWVLKSPLRSIILSWWKNWSVMEKGLLGTWSP